MSTSALYKACARLLSLPEPIVEIPGVVVVVVVVGGTTIMTTWLPKRQATQGVSVDGNENSNLPLHFMFLLVTHSKFQQLRYVMVSKEILLKVCYSKVIL